MSERMNKERAREVIDGLRRKIKTEVWGCENRLENEVDIDRIQQCKTEIILFQERLQALDIAIESLDNEWVDVRDRLPSDDKFYLVTANNELYIASYDNKTNNWWSETYDFSSLDVIAWRPLPQPYVRKERLIERMDEDGIRYQCDNCLHIMEDYETRCINCGAQFKSYERKE